MFAALKVGNFQHKKTAQFNSMHNANGFRVHGGTVGRGKRAMDPQTILHNFVGKYLFVLIRMQSA